MHRQQVYGGCPKNRPSPPEGLQAGLSVVDAPAQGGASCDASGGRPDASAGASMAGAQMQARGGALRGAPGAPAEAPHALQAWQGIIHARRRRVPCHATGRPCQWLPLSERPLVPGQPRPAVGAVCRAGPAMSGALPASPSRPAVVLWAHLQAHPCLLLRRWRSRCREAGRWERLERLPRHRPSCTSRHRGTASAGQQEPSWTRHGASARAGQLCTTQALPMAEEQGQSPSKAASLTDVASSGLALYWPRCAHLPG